MARSGDYGFLKGCGLFLMGLGALVFCSGVSEYVAEYLAHNAASTLGLSLLLAVPFKLFGGIATLYHFILAETFSLPMPNRQGAYGGFIAFDQAVLHTWILPAIGVGLYLLSKRSWHVAYLIPLVAVIFPNSLAGRRRKAQSGCRKACMTFETAPETGRFFDLCVAHHIRHSQSSRIA